MKTNLYKAVALFIVVVFAMCDNDSVQSPDGSEKYEMSFSVHEQTVNEDCGSVNVTVNLNKPAEKIIEIPFSISGTAQQDNDFTVSYSAITIESGSSAATIQIPIVNDVDVEASETIIVTLHTTDALTAGMNDTTTTITIISEDQPADQSVSLSFFERGIYEGCGELRLAATITQPSVSDLVIPFSLSGNCEIGTDYTVGGTSFNFGVGQTRCTTTVAIVNDTEVEEPETLQVNLAPPSTVALGDTSILNIMVYSDDGEEHTIYKCIIANGDVEGWTQSIYESDLVATKGDELFNVINGGAVPYINNGYNNGFRQIINGPDETSFTCMAMNFLVPEKCNALYAEKAASLSDPIEIPGMAADSATGFTILGGITVYTKIGPYYFELVLSGYSSQDAATQMAKTFIELFSARLAT